MSLSDSSLGPDSFGTLLRRLRLAAGLTQEELAELARLSPRAVSDLERGINQSPRRETARLLANALGLTGTAREQFEAAARRKVVASDTWARTPRPDAGVAAATRTLPRDVASFTGREPELRRLLGAAAESLRTGNAVTICAVGGMAGVGKTALAVRAAHKLAPRFPDGQIFLPLHGHTPGQAPIEPEQALASLLQSAGVAVEHVPQGLETRVRLWRDYLAGRKFLIVLDDAVGHDQVRPLLPGTAGSLVLITSRRHLTALEDTQAISLDVLPPIEAAELMVKLADRPDDVRASDPAVAEIIKMCGYLPLAIGMLARQLHHHPAWTVTGLAANLTQTQDRLALMHAENLSVAAAFDLSYYDLDSGPQRLFRRLGLHPGTDIDAYAAAALDGADLNVTRGHLEDLYDHYLADEPTPGRYLIHDLLGEHARTLSAADHSSDREAAVNRLLDYYLHMATAASRQLARRSRTGPPSVEAPLPTHAPSLRTDVEAIQWLDAERVNLYALSMYAAGNSSGYAIAIPAVMHGYLRHQGRWDQVVTLHDAAIQTARNAGDRHGEANALTDLGDIQLLSSDYPAAIESLNQAIALHREHGNALGEANALAILGYAQHLAGNHATAAEYLTGALGLHRGNGDQLGEATALAYLNYVQQAGGDHATAKASLTRSLELHRILGNRLGEAQVLNAAGELALKRRTVDKALRHHAEALAIASAIASAPDEAQALEGIGQCHLMAGDSASAQTTLTQALAIYERIGSAHADRVRTLLPLPSD